MIRIKSYEEKAVKDVEKTDERIKIIGTVIDIDDTKITIDDGTGKIDIILGEYSKIDPSIVKIGDIVKVFARVYSKDGIKVFGDLIQIINGMDINSYLKLREDIKKIRGELNV